eukprot:jgi/Botrbrau1/21723/Bobra.43_1s0117.1
MEGRECPTDQGPILDPFAHMHPALRKMVILVKPAPGETPYPGICGLGCRVCRNVCFPFDRASPFWLIHSVIFNAPPAAAAAVIGIINLPASHCARNLPLFLFLTVILFNFGAIGFAARIYFVALKPLNPLGVGQGRMGALKRTFVPNVCQRAFHVCSDPVGALYAVWLLAALAWPILGALWAAQSVNAEDPQAPPSCAPSLVVMVVVSAGTLAVYSLSLLAFFVCTCCCQLSGWLAGMANPSAATATALRLHQALEGTAPASAGPGLGEPLLKDEDLQGRGDRIQPPQDALEAGIASREASHPVAQV